MNFEELLTAEEIEEIDRELASEHYKIVSLESLARRKACAVESLIVAQKLLEDWIEDNPKNNG